MKKSTGWLLQGRNFGNHFENIDFKNPFWYMVEIYSTDKFIDRTRPKSQTDPACHRTDRTCYPQVSICFGALGLIWGRFGVILERKPKTVQSIFVHQSFFFENVIKRNSDSDFNAFFTQLDGKKLDEACKKDVFRPPTGISY